MTPKKGKSEEKARKEQEKAGMEAFAKELEANSDEEKEKASTAEGANKGNLQKESECNKYNIYLIFWLNLALVPLTGENALE